MLIGRLLLLLLAAHSWFAFNIISDGRLGFVISVGVIYILSYLIAPLVSAAVRFILLGYGQTRKTTMLQQDFGITMTHGIQQVQAINCDNGQ